MLSPDSLQSYQEYREVLLIVDNHRFEELAQITRDLRDKSWMNEKIRRLLSTRLSLLNSTVEIPDEFNNFKADNLPWIEVEAQFVQGLSLFHQGRFSEGREMFLSSARNFSDLKIDDRSFLSHFNAYVGKVNSDPQYSTNDRLKDIQALERKFYSRKDEDCMANILALVLREKAILYFTDGRYRAALHHSNEASELLRSSGTLGDLHLSMLLSSLCAFRLKKIEDSLLYFEQVILPVESRVEFAYDLMSHYLGFLKKMPRPDSYTICGPFWKNVVMSPQDDREIVEYALNKSSGELTNLKDQQTFLISKNGKMMSLLSTLIKGKQSRVRLTETLWPEASASNDLDNRLHQLFYQLKKKYQIKVKFDGALYQLENIIIAH